MDKLLFFNIICDLCGIIFSIVGITAMFIFRKFLNKTFKFSLYIFITDFVALISNLCGLLLRGSSGKHIHFLLTLTNFFEFASGYTLAFLFTIFLFYYLEIKGIKIKHRAWLYVYYAIMLLMLFVSQFNGMFYYIDGQNIYHRGSLFVFSQLFGILLTAIDLIIIICYRKYLGKNDLYAFVFYTVSPTIALAIQMFFYGIYLLLLITTVGVFVLFIMLLSIQVKQYYEKEKEVSDMKYLLLQSQLQPHFLFNSLVAIKHLCKTDPSSAAQAVEDFSYFLRGNLDSITAECCIPFTSEMEHIKNYIALEEKRFGDKLKIDFDLQETDFSIPPLTLQPIVENAIKYGTMQKIEGVCVKIASLSDDKRYYIKVSDNGNGFDPDNYKSDGKKHIGIDCVKNRLQNMCKGKLIINSIIGQGTEVTVSIPKEVINR